MGWNPEIYNKFKSERFAPFYDLVALLKVKNDMDVVDLGCGTGELTAKLVDYLPGSKITGIDSSQEMLNDAETFRNPQVSFICRTIEDQMMLDEKWDLVFSNAAIQWVDDHKKILPQMVSSLKSEGQLLIQMPAQPHNITNILLNDLADKEPYHAALSGWQRKSPVLDIGEYGQLLFEHGSKSMTLYEKIYPIVLKDVDALVDWVSGAALIPYIQKLPQELGIRFKQDYKNILLSRFNSSPVFYPFKRMIIEAGF